MVSLTQLGFEDIMDQDKIDAYNADQAAQADAQKQQDNHQEIATSLNNLLLATMVSKDPKMVEVAQNLSELLSGIAQASDQFSNSNLQLLPIANHELALSVQDLATKVQQHSPIDLVPYFQQLTNQIARVADTTPVVNVPEQSVSFDAKPLIDAVKEIKKAIADNKVDIPKTNLDGIVKGLKSVQNAVESQQFPVPNFILPFKDVNGKAVQVQLDSSGNLPVSVTGGSSGTQYADGAARGTATGTLAMVDDGTLIQSAKGDSDGTLNSNQTKIAGTTVDTNSGSKSAGTQRVVIATDQPSLTNKLLVTPDLPALASTSTKQSDGSQKTQIVDGSGNVNGMTSNALDVNIKSGSSGGTQYAEDTAHVSGDLVNMAGVVQQTADSALSNDGDRSLLQVDSSGYLKVNIKAGAGSGGTAMTDDAAFTVGTTSVTPVAGTYKSTRDSVDDNDAGALAMTQKRGLYTTIETPNGDSAMDDTNDTVNVTVKTALPVGTNEIGGVNNTKVAGTAIDVNSGNKSAGTQRVVLATDQPTIPTTLLTNGVTSTANSTAVNLSGAAAFTGTSEDVTNYSAIQVSVFSSHVSATDGLSLQQSSDGSNWDITDTYTIPATSGKTFQIQPAAKFYRLVYTNGATLTTSLRIQTVYHIMSPTPSSQRAADAYTNETDLTQVWTFNGLYNGTTWDRMRGDITNGLDVDVTRLPSLVAGSAVIGKVGIDQTTPGTTNLVALSAETTKVIGTVNQGTSPWVTSNATTSVVGNGAAATAQRVTLANDSTGILGTVGTVTTVSTLTGTTTLTPGGGAANLGKAEDATHTTGDTGVFALAVRNDNAATSTTNANADYSQISTDITGTVFIRQSPSNTPTLANVAGSATSVTLLAANAARRSAIFYNDSTSDCYIKYGTTASTTSFTYYLPSLGTLSIDGNEYAGRVDGIWVSAAGNMRVTETAI